MSHKTVELTCPNCRKTFETTDFGEVIPCPHCGQRLTKIAQLGQLLDQWFYPRRWRADLLEPNPYYLLEKLWTANGQGETLYRGVAPHNANYDIFRNMVTRLVARGVDEGWIDLEFPDDPLEENPIFQLKFRDSDRFAREVEALFPEVDWDEQIEVPLPVSEGSEPETPRAAPATRTPTPMGSARQRRKGRRGA